MTAVSVESPRRVLLLTYYFPPDLSAGSFRAEALANALLVADPSLKLDIVTTEPNRYQRHCPSATPEDATPYRVARIPLPAKRHGLFGQIRSFLAFANGVRKQTTGSQYDLVIATSSRLMTAVLGTWVGARAGSPVYLDIRDIFLETLDDVFPGPLLWPVRRLFSVMERWPLNRAHRVNLVSEGFLPYFRKRYTRRDYALFTNGIDDQFVALADQLPSALPCERSGQLPHVVYAGNIGDGQGLEKILPALAATLGGRARITVVGDGGARGRLLAECKRYSIDITVLDPIPRNELLTVYDSADVLFLHLNDYPAFERVLPSKLFEYAATGKPILAGVSGYARAFIERELPGAGVFSPCNVAEAEAAFMELSLEVTDRSAFVARFSRHGIMARMAWDVLSCLPEPGND
ncbi:MAG: glycosyltransferase family 4 protein [Marinobacter sp.]|nr:glycosyltransferase family 4 protein [Marinobacter sp.]